MKLSQWLLSGPAVGQSGIQQPRNHAHSAPINLDGESGAAHAVFKALLLEPSLCASG